MRDIGSVLEDRTDPIVAVLYVHREDGLVCYDAAAGTWCCPCGEHDIRVTWRTHVAEHLRMIPKEDQ